MTENFISSIRRLCLTILVLVILFKLFKSANNFLLILLILEFFILSNFIIFIFMRSYFALTSSFILTFLTFSVCEARVGLALLIKLTRQKGVDRGLIIYII